MSIQDEWLERFRAAVTSEIDAARGKAADGYRAVASKTGLGYDYIYQIYNGKPAHKPKRPSAEAMDSLKRAYSDVPSMAVPLQGSLTPAPSGSAELAHAIEKVETALEKIKAATPNTVHIEHAWPFGRIKREQWESMTPAQKDAVETIIQTMLPTQHAAGASASHTEKRQATG